MTNQLYREADEATKLKPVVLQISDENTYQILYSSIATDR